MSRSSSVHWLVLDTILTGVDPFFLLQLSLASRSSAHESEPMELSRWPKPRFSPDLGGRDACSGAPTLRIPFSISSSAASMMWSSASPSSLSLLPSSSASSPASRSSSTGCVSCSSPSNGGMPRALLGTSFRLLDRMKCPPWGRGVDENFGMCQELPCPRPEGVGVPESNL